MHNTGRQLISSGSPFEPRIGFSRAVRVGATVMVSGTAPIGSDGKTVGTRDAAAQARRCFEIIGAALQKAGASLSEVVRTRMFITDVQNWEAIGRVHGEFFREVHPASTVVQVAGLLDPDWLVEIEADAIIGSSAG